MSPEDRARRTLQPFDSWAWAPPLMALILIALVYASGINTATFLWINHVGSVTGDALWANLTIFGDGLVAFVLLLPLLRRRPELVWAGFLAAAAAILWVHTLRPLFHLPRPPAVLPHELFRVIGPPYREGSFPSGHTTTVFALAGVMALSVSSYGLRTILLAFASMVGVARIVDGVHWPLDVIAGMLGGWLSAIFGVWGARRWPWGTGTYGRRVLAALLLSAALLLLAHDTGYPQAVALQRIIAGAALLLGLLGLKDRRGSWGAKNGNGRRRV
jgi:membrane-associated phospholipid phosphatase